MRWRLCMQSSRACASSTRNRRPACEPRSAHSARLVSLYAMIALRLFLWRSRAWRASPRRPSHCWPRRSPGWLTGSWEISSASTPSGASSGRHSEQRHTRLIAFDRAVEAAVELQQLRFGLAGRLAQDALALLPRQGVRAFPISPLPTVVLAQVLYEQGALSEVEALARDRLPLVTVRASPETAVRVYPLLARIAAQRRQVGLALFLLEEGAALGEAHGWGRLTTACLQQRVELLVRGRRIEEAQTCLERMRPLFNAKEPISLCAGAAIRGYFELARSRIELACKPSLEIVARVRHLHHEAAASGDLYLAVQLAICLAEALGAVDEQAAAHETLSRSLELGASVGLHQSFARRRPCRLAACSSLRPSVSDVSVQPYVGSLLNSWRSAHESAGTLKISKLSGPLSARECTRSLGLVRRGYSRTSGSLMELRIAPETVKVACQAHLPEARRSGPAWTRCPAPRVSA